MQKQTIYSKSEQDTARAGAELAAYIRDVMLGQADDDCARLFSEHADGTAYVALRGDLGSGKTVFVRGMASVLTPDAPVQSPSYTIVNEYIGEKLNLYHFDMYRITGEDDLYSIGFYDYSDAVLAIEWSEKIPYALPRVYFRVSFSRDDEGNRTIVIELVDSEKSEQIGDIG